MRDLPASGPTYAEYPAAAKTRGRVLGNADPDDVYRDSSFAENAAPDGGLNAPATSASAQSKSFVSKLHALPGLPVLPPRNAVIELVVFFVVVMGLEWGLQSFPDLNEFEPHPFWLPVLLLSLQYGTVSGLLAAGIAIVLTAFMGWPEQDIGENHFNYLIRIWTQPVLWLSAAMLLGQFRMRQISERRELHRLADELYTQREAIADNSAHLRKRCEMLERKIAGGETPGALALLDAFAALGRADPQEIHSGFDSIMQAAFGPGQYSLFVLNDRELSLVCSSGWDEQSSWRQKFSADDALFVAISQASDGVTVLRRQDDSALSDQGLAAIAVRSGSAERLLGMLKVEFMEPARFDHQVLSRLEVVAGQLVAALELQGVDDLLAGRQAKSDQNKRNIRWRRLNWKSRRREMANASKTSDVLKKPKIVR